DEIIKGRGYPAEVHYVTTEDGYIITVFRIPHGKNEIYTTKEQPKQPVFLLHGVGLNSESYINVGEKSLGFLLADAGYDVWIGNFRGTMYARNHTKLSITDTTFWDFSFHEMGIYDVPAQVDFVSGTTKQKIIYIGYSLGTTTAFIFGTTHPEIAEEKVKEFICLAPATFLYKWKSSTKYLFPLWPYLKPIIEWFTNGMFYIREFPPHQVRDVLCLPFPFQMDMCQFADMLAWGFNYEQSDPETLPVTLIQNSDATSTKAMSHMIQLASNDGKFEQFDYGQKKNMEIYGTYDPPIYDLSKFRVPVYIIRGENDLLSTKENIERLNASLPEKVKAFDIYVVQDDKFNHGDFLVAKDVVPLLYNHILDIIPKVKLI
ncbi:hypothetical protein ILUMI_10736, partial [Ignelater luminosus]